MVLTAAKAAGALAAQIQPRVDMLSIITALIAAGGYRLSQLRAVGPNGDEVNLLLGALDAPTSAQALAYAQQVYQTQLDALNAQLASL